MLLTDFSASLHDKRQSQVNIITGRLWGKGYTRESFAGRQPHALDAARVAAITELVTEGMRLYGIQGLWTAAHYRLPVTFVLCNNAQYEILKVGARGMNLPHASAGRFLGMDLKDPEIDYVALARSLGVEAVRVADMDELAERVRTSLAGDRPMLFDVPLTRDLPDGLRYT